MRSSPAETPSRSFGARTGRRLQSCGTGLRNTQQNVVGFEEFLQSHRDLIDPELLANKVCGRWRNGVPLALSPETDSPPGGIAAEQLNDFEYVN
jgi:hypothetical protein